jgi:hypothetical protein
MFFAARNSTTRSAAPVAVQTDAMHLWDAWLFAAAEATLKLRIWTTAPREGKAQTHAAYLAALDREEHAALVLGKRLRPEGD